MNLEKRETGTEVMHIDAKTRWFLLNITNSWHLGWHPMHLHHLDLIFSVRSMSMLMLILCLALYLYIHIHISVYVALILSLYIYLYPSISISISVLADQRFNTYFLMHTFVYIWCMLCRYVRMVLIPANSKATRENNTSVSRKYSPFIRSFSHKRGMHRHASLMEILIVFKITAFYWFYIFEVHENDIHTPLWPFWLGNKIMRASVLRGEIISCLTSCELKDTTWLADFFSKDIALDDTKDDGLRHPVLSKISESPANGQLTICTHVIIHTGPCHYGLLLKQDQIACS